MLEQPNQNKEKYIKTAKSLALIFAPFVILMPFRLTDKIDPLTAAAFTCLYMMSCIFIKMQLTGNHSLGDEMWSTVPIQYAFMFNNWSTRGMVMLLMVTAWGVRLSFNLWRKGGFQDLEDYRWQAIKNRLGDGTWQFWLYKVLIITIYQCILNFCLVLPVYFAPTTPLGLWDYLTGLLMVVFIVFEAVADQQQWFFQSNKKKLVKDGKLSGEYELGFMRKGLFYYSRHPNYFGELGFWWNLYFMSGILNWGFLGVLQMTLLFQRIIKITEDISVSKYPEYSNYQKCTSKLIPLPPSEWPQPILTASNS